MIVVSTCNRVELYVGCTDVAAARAGIERFISEFHDVPEAELAPHLYAKSGYDAVLHWLPNTEPDLAGYTVLVRSTTSPVWERETWVGKVTRFSMPDVSIDDVVIGVRAVDEEGNQSVVSCYTEPVVPSMLTPAEKK